MPAMLAAAHGADITAQLASQIASKAGASRAAFDFALEPQGLGRVDVSLKIDQQGQLSAVLSFDNPSAAAEAKSRAGDLQQALQQAGFDIGQSGLSFTSGGSQGQGAAWQAPSAPAYAAPLAAASAEAATTPTPAANATGAGGLDITI
jgi:flagellar hook-length control protein FliK